MKIQKSTEHFIVTVNEHCIADTQAGLWLKEGFSKQLYIPLADVKEDYLIQSDHQTHCPFKGKASYYHLSVAGKQIDNALWYYPEPANKASDIANHVAFYKNKVTIQSA